MNRYLLRNKNRIYIGHLFLMDYVKDDDKRCVGRKKGRSFIQKINVINAGLYYFRDGQ